MMKFFSLVSEYADGGPTNSRRKAIFLRRLWSENRGPVLSDGRRPRVACRVFKMQRVQFKTRQRADMLH